MEKLLEEKLPNSGHKASPYIESCMKTLKRQIYIIMDMLTHGSEFSLNNEKKMVLCDQDVFECWIQYFLSCMFLLSLFYEFLFHNILLI